MTPLPTAGPVIQLTRSRRRRRRNPLLVFALLLLTIGAVVFLWYSVFSPLFVDPHDWAASEREFRRSLRQMLLGSGNTSAIEPDLPRWPPQLDDTRLKIVTCADSQMAQGIRFSASYYGMDYPWGDVPSHVGTSPDLVIRCLREAGIDLQQMVHIDRKRRPRHYPLHIWGHPRPDRSIDHRRIPNLYTFVQTYFERQSIRVDSAEKCAGFIPGDIVFWAGQGGSEYPNMTGLVTDRRNEEGVPYVVTLHRDDRVVTDSHLLTDWTVTGHYQVDRDALLHRFLTEHPSANLLARPIP